MHRVSWPKLAFLLVAAMFALRSGLALRPGLWADEIFSLAMATGHSLEHPARDADPPSGGFRRAARARVCRRSSADMASTSGPRPTPAE